MTYQDNNPNRRRNPMTRDSEWGMTPWILGALAVLIVLGLVLWSTTGNMSTASNSNSSNSGVPTTNSLQQGGSNTTGSAATKTTPNAPAPAK